SRHAIFGAPCAPEPRGACGARLWSQTQPQRGGMCKSAAAGASHTTALRFMEPPLSFSPMHWDHEPPNWSAGLQPGAISVFLARRTWRSWSSALRFMGSPDAFFGAHWDHEPRGACGARLWSETQP